MWQQLQQWRFGNWQGNKRYLWLTKVEYFGKMRAEIGTHVSKPNFQKRRDKNDW